MKAPHSSPRSRSLENVGARRSGCPVTSGKTSQDRYKTVVTECPCTCHTLVQYEASDRSKLGLCLPSRTNKMQSRLRGRRMRVAVNGYRLSHFFAGVFGRTGLHDPREEKETHQNVNIGYASKTETDRGVFGEGRGLLTFNILFIHH